MIERIKEYIASWVDLFKPAPPEPAPRPKIIKVNYEYQREIRGLIDDWDKGLEQGGGSLPAFLLWDRLGDLYPQTRKGLWEIESDNYNVYLIRIQCDKCAG